MDPWTQLKQLAYKPEQKNNERGALKVFHKNSVIYVHDWRLVICWAVPCWCSSESVKSRGSHCGGRGMPRGSVTWPSCRFFTSWASQRLVVVSSLRTCAKVVSLSWSGRHCRKASLALHKMEQTQVIHGLNSPAVSCFLPPTSQNNLAKCSYYHERWQMRWSDSNMSLTKSPAQSALTFC